MTDRRYSLTVPIVVAVALLIAICAVCACSYLLVTGGRP